ncbi:MAG TPA: hypothetical protein DCM40_01030, partial [Maribacter sp.]|nr:hypothetical protein [Maribacter sp.]
DACPLEFRGAMTLDKTTTQADTVMLKVKGQAEFDSPVDIADHISDGLHVKKTDSGNETTALRLQNDATGTSKVALVFTATTTDTFDNAKIVSGRNSSGQASGDLRFFTRENGGSLTERLTILPDGKVGIGVTAPDEALSVAGNLHVRGASAAEQTVLQLGQLDSDASAPLYTMQTQDDGDDRLDLVSKRYNFILKLRRGDATGELEIGGIVGSYQTRTELFLNEQLDFSSNTMTRLVQLRGGRGEVSFIGVDKSAAGAGVGAGLGINTGSTLATGVNFQVKGISQFDSPVTIFDKLTIDKNTQQSDNAILHVKGRALFDSPQIDFTTTNTQNGGISLVGSHKYTPVKIGKTGNVHGTSGTAIGAYVASTGSYTTASGQYGVALGAGANSTGGFHAIAIGAATAAGQTSFSVGHYSQANAQNSIAIGYRATTHSGATNTVAFGPYCYANNTNADNSVAIGHQAQAVADSVVAIGDNAEVDSSFTVGIGHDVDVNSTAFSSVVIGNDAEALGSDESVVIGKSASGQDDTVICIGKEAVAKDTKAICIGRSTYANSNSQRSVVIGDNAEAGNAVSIAIGDAAKSSAVRGMAIGYGTDVRSNHHESFAIGKFVQQGTTNAGEIGWWSSSAARVASVKMDGNNGMVSMTIRDNSNAPTDERSTIGDEDTDGDLGRGMFTIQKNGTAVTLFFNNAGTIQSLSLGTLS